MLKDTIHFIIIIQHMNKDLLNIIYRVIKQSVIAIFSYVVCNCKKTTTSCVYVSNFEVVEHYVSFTSN